MNIVAITRIGLIIVLLGLLSCNNDGQEKNMQKTQNIVAKKRTYNHLQFESSPYLLQHADNPVDWYPWGKAAFDKANKENKPIFLSIGYSTCHWCHVMEKESFEDSEVAALLNKSFVCIKVDREERPDIDKIYMNACTILTGSGGWPLTIIMTPDKRPFFAGTYFPKKGMMGRPGMLDLIPYFGELWKNKQEKVLSAAIEITTHLQKMPKKTTGTELNEAVLRRAYLQLSANFDDNFGGFADAPKFPTPHNLLFLLRYWKRSKNPKALFMVEKTLREMRKGGIYDHIGFGFHRYSTDRRWLVPHFEKMLYDQALLAMVYSEIYQITGDKLYRQTAMETLDYCLRDMLSPQGGFYCAQDADSEGVEGKFYLWTVKELEEILGEKRAKLAIRVFNAKPGGNFSDADKGENILHLSAFVPQLASKLGMSEQNLRQELEVIRAKLFVVRERRVHPRKDDKILTDWNGLMMAALAKAGRVFNEPKYLKAAKRTANFILSQMVSEGRLLHRYRQGKAGIPAYIDDYAFFVMGLFELYQSSYEERYLQAALEFNDRMLEHFWDKEGGCYFYPNDGEKLIIRQKEIYDGAIPSGNSIAALNLLRLGKLVARPKLEKKGRETLDAFSQKFSHSPIAYTQSLCALDFALGPCKEVVIVSGNGESEMLEKLDRLFAPNMVVLFKPIDVNAIVAIAPFIKDYQKLGDKATAYVCRNYACQQPTTDIGKMLELSKP